VRVSGPQFDGDTSATVVRIGDPALDGTDYVTVRVKVNGMLDELAFAPAELSVGRAQPAGRRPRATTKAPAAKAPAAKAPAATAPAAKAPAPKAPAAKPTATRPAPDAPDQGAPAEAATPARAAAAGETPPAGPSRRRKSVPVPKVSFTVASSGASWAVSASRGAKGIVKNVAVRPGVVTALAELLDQPALRDAVAEINETARSEAHARAEQLRAELDRLEAVLATHRSPGGQPRP
jgi:hypothetical protein